VGFVEEKLKSVLVKLDDPESVMKFQESFQKIGRSDLFADRVNVFFNGKRYDNIPIRQLVSALHGNEPIINSGFNNNGQIKEELPEEEPEPEEKEEDVVRKVEKVENPAPTEEVNIRFPEAGLSISAYYHGVIFSNPYVILVWDTRASGYPKIIPEKQRKLRISVQRWGLEDFLVMSLGTIFKHNNYEYSILVSIPENLEERIKQVKQNQEQSPSQDQPQLEESINENS